MRQPEPDDDCPSRPPRSKTDALTDRDMCHGFCVDMLEKKISQACRHLVFNYMDAKVKTFMAWFSIDPDLN